MTSMPHARPPLAPARVEEIRRERYAPHPTQCDYLHLRDLLAALTGALVQVPPTASPTLDLYCGTQPYRELVPGTVWGLDLDRHFGRADVIGAMPLPFADATFGLVLCTQALHLVDDPSAAVREMQRVLRPGGMAIVTVPHIFRREVPQERALTATQLRTLFDGWTVAVTGFGGLGGAAAFAPASLLHGAARRMPALRTLLPATGVTLTALGTVVDALTLPLRTRVPANWLVVARSAGASDGAR